MKPNLTLTKDSLFHKIFGILENLRIKPFLHKKGPKLYETLEKLAFLVYKVVNSKSYRDLEELAVNGKTPHFTTLQKFADNLGVFLLHKLKAACYLVCEQVKRTKFSCAIDGTGLSKSTSLKTL